MLETTYYLMLACFITHELDAVKRHEWRILPVFSSLSDRVGAQVFIWVHVPLFALLFLLGGAEPTTFTAYGLSVFSIIHVFLHLNLRKHPEYEFNNLSSWMLIIGAGLFGGLHLLTAQL